MRTVHWFTVVLKMSEFRDNLKLELAHQPRHSFFESQFIHASKTTAPMSEDKEHPSNAP
jgi:hypothetical protein